MMINYTYKCFWIEFVLFLFSSHSIFAEAAGPRLITDYGVVVDGETVNTEAIHATIDTCAAAGGGTVMAKRRR